MSSYGHNGAADSTKTERWSRRCKRKKQEKAKRKIEDRRRGSAQRISANTTKSGWLAPACPNSLYDMSAHTFFLAFNFMPHDWSSLVECFFFSFFYSSFFCISFSFSLCLLLSLRTLLESVLMHTLSISVCLSVCVSVCRMRFLRCVLSLSVRFDHIFVIAGHAERSQEKTEKNCPKWCTMWQRSLANKCIRALVDSFMFTGVFVECPKSNLYVRASHTRVHMLVHDTTAVWKCVRRDTRLITMMNDGLPCGDLNKMKNVQAIPSQLLECYQWIDCSCSMLLSGGFDLVVMRQLCIIWSSNMSNAYQIHMSYNSPTNSVHTFSPFSMFRTLSSHILFHTGCVCLSLRFSVNVKSNIMRSIHERDKTL